MLSWLLIIPFFLTTCAYGCFIEKSRIDEQKQKIEQALLKRNKYIESIIENLPIGFAINSIDDGDVQFINKRFQEIYGWSQDILTNTSIFFEKVFPDPNFRKEMQSKIMADMESGGPARIRWDNLKIVSSSGEIKYVHAFNISVADQNLLISTVQDVTDRKLAEDKIKDSL